MSQSTRDNAAVEAVIKNSLAAESIIHPKICDLDHEEVWAMYLTTRNTLIGTEMLSKGTLTQTCIDCRTVLRQVLLRNAAALILLHNHPSGDPKPSTQDIHFTARLKKACDLFEVQLLDHIITAEKGFYSFSEERIIPFNQ